MLPKMEHNDENIERLAKLVLDSWDLDTLLSFVMDKLIADYKKDEVLFFDDVNLMDMKEEYN